MLGQARAKVMGAIYDSGDKNSKNWLTTDTDNI